MLKDSSFRTLNSNFIDTCSEDSEDVDKLSLITKPLIEDVSHFIKLTRETGVLLECDTGLANLLNWSPRAINHKRFIKQHIWDGDYVILREALNNFTTLLHVSSSKEQNPDVALSDQNESQTNSGKSIPSKNSSNSQNTNAKFFLRMNLNTSEMEKPRLEQYRSFIVTLRSSIRTTQFVGQSPIPDESNRTNVDLDANQLEEQKLSQPQKSESSITRDSGCIVSGSETVGTPDEKSFQNFFPENSNSNENSSESKSSPPSSYDYTNDDQVYLCLVVLRPSYSNNYSCPPLINRFVTHHGLGGKLVMLPDPKKALNICTLSSILGWLPQDLYGSKVATLTDLVHKDDWAELYRPIKDAIRSPNEAKSWIPSHRWRCANGSTCLVQSFVRRRKFLSKLELGRVQILDHTNSNSTKNRDLENNSSENRAKDLDPTYYLEILHEIVQGPKTLFNFFSPPNNKQFQIPECFGDEEMMEEFEKKIASGERHLRVSEYWFARLMSVYRELNGPPKPQYYQVTGINYLDSESADKEVITSSYLPTLTTLQFGAAVRNNHRKRSCSNDSQDVHCQRYDLRTNTQKMREVKRGSFGHQKQDSVVPINFQKDLEHLEMINTTGNPLIFNSISRLSLPVTYEDENSQNMSSRFRKWQQLDKVKRYLFSIEKAKRAKQFPRIRIHPTRHKIDFDSGSEEPYQAETYDSENASKHVFNCSEQFFHEKYKRRKIHECEEKVQLQKVALTSRNLAKHQQYFMRSKMKDLSSDTNLNMPIRKIKNDNKITNRQINKCNATPGIRDVEVTPKVLEMDKRKNNLNTINEGAPSSSSGSYSSLFKFGKKILHKKSEMSTNQRNSLSLLFKMEEAIIELIKINVIQSKKDLSYLRRLTVGLMNSNPNNRVKGVSHCRLLKQNRKDMNFRGKPQRHSPM